MKTYFYLFLLLMPLSGIAQDEVWQLKGKDHDVVQFLATDAQQNLYVTGYFDGDVDFNGLALKSLNENDTNTASGYSRDIFLAKYDANENLLWHKVYGGFYASLTNDLITDAAGNVTLAAEFYWNLWDGSDSLKGIDYYDVGILKISPDGDKLWSLVVASVKLLEFTKMQTDANNDIYITGHCTDTFYINGTAYYEPKMRSFILKVSSAGQVEWVKIISGEPGSIIRYVHPLPSGNIIVAGQHSTDKFLINSTELFGTDTGKYYFFVAELDATDNLQWATKGYGNYNYVNDLAIDGSGNIYLTGIFGSYLVWQQYQLTSLGKGTSTFPIDYDTYVAKLNKDGDILWVKTGGTENNPDYYSGLTIMPNQNILLRARYAKNYSLLGDTVLNSSGFEDYVLAELNRNNGELIRFTNTKGSTSFSMTYISDVHFWNNKTVVAGKINVKTQFGGTEITSGGRDDGFVWIIPEMFTNIQEKPEQHLKVSLYPNPANEVVYITTPEDASIEQLKVFDATGKEVHAARLPRNSTSQTIETKNWPAGIYFIQVQTAGGVATKKLVMSR